MCSACRDRIEMTLPLEDLLVVSVEQAVAAPQCTCRLADAGARVIKIERPEGDFARHYDNLVHGESANFVWLNRGKESVVLDLGKPEDKVLLEAMLAKADVFVQNLKPGALAKLGFAVEAPAQATIRGSSAARSPATARRSVRAAKGLRPADPGGVRPRLGHRRPGSAGARRCLHRRHRRGSQRLRGYPRGADRALNDRQRRGYFHLDVRCHGGMDDGAAAEISNTAIRSSASGSPIRPSRLTGRSRPAMAPRS